MRPKARGGEGKVRLPLSSLTAQHTSLIELLLKEGDLWPTQRHKHERLQNAVLFGIETEKRRRGGVKKHRRTRTRKKKVIALGHESQEPSPQKKRNLFFFCCCFASVRIRIGLSRAKRQFHSVIRFFFCSCMSWSGRHNSTD